MQFHKNNSHSATHSTSKTEKQIFQAKTTSTFYMVVSNKALIPYNMHVKYDIAKMLFSLYYTFTS